MKFNLLLVGLVGITATKAHALGQEVGNGGNIIVCNPASANAFSGYYSLDFLLTYPGLPSVDVSSWQTSLATIGSLIKAKVPELYASFKSFEDDVYNTSYSKQHVWESAPFGLVTVDDQHAAVLLPDNCLVNGKLNLIQAVIRLNPDFSGAETQVFQYMPTAIDTLNADRPLQTSFLLVHEWLWELSSNIDRNRRIDRYLHSTDFAGATAADALSELRGMGLQLTGDRYAFDSIQDAIDGAPSGATILLLNQTYNEGLTINKPLILKPKDSTAHPVVFSPDIDVSADDVTIDGLAFDCSIGAMRISGHHAKVTRNHFYSNNDRWAVVLQHDADAVLSDNVFDTLSSALTLMDSSAAVVQQNKFNGVKTPVDGGGSSLKVDNNTFDDCGEYCVSIDGPDATVSGNEFVGSDSGVVVKNTQQTSIANNHFKGNKTGLSLLSNGGEVSVQGNTFEANHVGIDNRAVVPLGANTFNGNDTDVNAGQ